MRFSPRKKIINVNMRIIQSNAKHGLNEPVCRVQEGRKIKYCNEVIIKGGSRLVYNPDHPLSCGAKVWIETYADIETYPIEELEN